MASDLLILQRKDRDKLGERHDQFQKGDVTSFVCVVVKADGTVEVDFDCADAQSLPLMNKLGGGLVSAIDHLRRLAVETQMRADILRGTPPAGRA